MFLFAMLALLASACNSVANALWKAQFVQIPLQTNSFQDFLNSVVRWRIFAGMLCYGISMLLFFYLLSNYKLSRVAPYLAMTYVFNFLIATLLFHETINYAQIVGVMLIIAGVIICNRA